MARKPPEQTVDYNGNMVSPAWQGTDTHAQVRIVGRPTYKYKRLGRTPRHMPRCALPEILILRQKIC